MMVLHVMLVYGQSISISLAEALSILQSVDSIREVVCFTLAAVLFAALFLLVSAALLLVFVTVGLRLVDAACVCVQWFSHSCSRRANCCTSLSSVMAVVLYVLVSLVATVTLGSLLILPSTTLAPCLQLPSSLIGVCCLCCSLHSLHCRSLYGSSCLHHQHQ